jgi:tetratricopeptide (TPR) repeat protein
VVVLGFSVLYVLKQRKQAEREAAEASQASPQDEAGALAEQAKAALEGDRFEEAARDAQAALDKDPLATAPRKLLAQARREQDAAKAYDDGQAKAAVGNEDEALRIFATIDTQSRFFARARIKAKDLAQDIIRRHGRACASATGRERWDEAADECAAALDIKCQLQDIDADPWLKALRRAEKALSRRVSWSCPPALASLFRDTVVGTSSAEANAESGARALRTLYPDDKIRDAINLYAQGETDRALRTLADPSVARGKSAHLAADLGEKIRLVDGRFRAGQTALLRNDLAHVDEIWGEALKGDAVLVPAGVDSALAIQMRSTLSQAHAKLGDEKFGNGQYASAYDEWSRGLAVAPKDPHLLDSLAQLEKVAEGILSGNPSCEQIQVAAHITRADPPSPAHQGALEASARCK